MAHVRLLRDQDEAMRLMERLGVDPKGAEIMAPKASFHVILIDGLDARRANILKQEALAANAEAAVPWGAIAGTQSDEKVAVFGTASQLRRLCHKLRQQPFKLAGVADEMEVALGNFNAPFKGAMKVGRAKLIFGKRALIMGILNVTPDSFSDGGKNLNPSKAIAVGIRMAKNGADIIDVGGESTRPGAEPVPLDVEIKRVVPVIEGLVKATKVPISIDTRHARVAERALDSGASIINDVSALSEPAMARLVAQRKVPVVLMHMLGTPKTMQKDPRYGDVVEEVTAFLSQRIKYAESMGISREQVIIDPGIGFGKTLEHNLELLRNLDQFTTLGCAVLIGTSRKGFLGALTGRPVAERAAASVVSSLAAATRGAHVVRVHDVAPMVDAIKTWTALRGWEEMP
jgi:dihydropteroate synthase